MSILDDILVRLGDRRLERQIARTVQLAQRVRELQLSIDDDEDNKFLLEQVASLNAELDSERTRADFAESECARLRERVREAESKLRDHELGVLQ